MYPFVAPHSFDQVRLLLSIKELHSKIGCSLPSTIRHVDSLHSHDKRMSERFRNWFTSLNHYQETLIKDKLNWVETS